MPNCSATTSTAIRSPFRAAVGRSWPIPTTAPMKSSLPMAGSRPLANAWSSPVPTRRSLFTDSVSSTATATASATGSTKPCLPTRFSACNWRAVTVRCRPARLPLPSTSRSTRPVTVASPRSTRAISPYRRPRTSTSARVTRWPIWSSPSRPPPTAPSASPLRPVWT